MSNAGGPNTRHPDLERTNRRWAKGSSSSKCVPNDSRQVILGL